MFADIGSAATGRGTDYDVAGIGGGHAGPSAKLILLVGFAHGDALYFGRMPELDLVRRFGSAASYKICALWPDRRRMASKQGFFQITRSMSPLTRPRKLRHFLT